ncbi:uncharacterized protein N7511_000799 [Penicillium nucicola]|uniref:uncharacterized protein n=1 Tax=Penicillium nucicola TaxID=1850975 RepID=UPI002545BB50|nr:uncharacterized protein N7511_000799 [Penicillium nucicola]KAJ5775788.1 hypothetical protein N7511_000799 [Penicillium nucicola]
MDHNEPLGLLHTAQEADWVDKVNMARVDGRLCDWATSLHPEKLPCRLIGGFLNGAYNLGQKFVFEDEKFWFLRLPRASSISPEHADEKVAMEVEALHLLLERTSVPVPKVYAWGLAQESPLGLGPFIYMNSIDGVCLSDILRGGDSRLLNEEISDTEIELIYKQIAQFMVQIFNIDFDQIGNLPTPKIKYRTPRRPLTWKAHEILRGGGVNTFDDHKEAFSTSGEYFQYINGQDWQQLRLQPNSISGPWSGISVYASLKILESLIPELTHSAYEQGPFKLICDDFGPANMIVRSKEDLTIIGVVDLEWVYAGPAQLFGSAPWWLLLDRPVNKAWDFEDGKAPKATERYFKCLEIFQRVLMEEELKMSGTEKLFELVEWSEDTGAMWLHMLLLAGFFDSLIFPFIQLRTHKGEDWWDEQVNKYWDTEQAKTFIATKSLHLVTYEEVHNKVKHYQSLMDDQKMERTDFIRNVSALLGCI